MLEEEGRHKLRMYYFCYEENNKKKWTAFIWACCLGLTKIVRLMITKGATQQYLEVKAEYRTVVMGSTK
jgi:ankyrin repeat protein